MGEHKVPSGTNLYTLSVGKVTIKDNVGMMHGAVWVRDLLLLRNVYGTLRGTFSGCMSGPFLERRLSMCSFWGHFSTPNAVQISLDNDPCGYITLKRMVPIT